MDKDLLSLVKKLAVRDNGVINQDASLERIVNALSTLVSREAADLEAIGPALAKFWDDRPGLKSITFDTLCSLTAVTIPGVNEHGFDEVKDRIADYVRAHTSDYYVGKRDGVKLMARCSTEEKAVIAANRALAAKKAADKATETAKTAAQ